MRLYCPDHPNYSPERRVRLRKNDTDLCKKCLLLYAIHAQITEQGLTYHQSIGAGGEYLVDQSGMTVTLPPEYGYYDDYGSGSASFTLEDLIKLGENAKRLKELQADGVMGGLILR